MKFFRSSLLLLLLPTFATARVGNIVGQRFLEESRRLEGFDSCIQCKTIQVAFHMFQDTAGTGPTATKWTDAQLDAEIVNLNTQWANTPFKFEMRELDGIDRHVRDDWNQADLTNKDVRNNIAMGIRVGGPTTVNVYVNDNAQICKTAGMATSVESDIMYPEDTFVGADQVSICGINTADRHTFIMSHEVGHWLSLKHTFEGNNCNGEGDEVDDTPQQAGPTEGCPDTPPDTCAGGGTDPIYNFMDYSSCEGKSFTTGQSERMYDHYIEWREKSLPCPEGQTQVDFEFLFDNEAWTNRLIVTKWGVPPGNKNFEFMESSVNYSNKKAFHQICYPRNTMYEMKLTDQNQNGIASPGYFKYSLNGEEVYSGGSWSNKPHDSVLIAGDSAECAAGQGRFKLEIVFDSRPNDLKWTIKDSMGNLIVDQTATTMAGRETYITNFIGSTLIFDQCLDAGSNPFTFTMTDTNGDGLLEGYYAFFVNGDEQEKVLASTFSEKIHTFTVAALPTSPDDQGGDTPAPTPDPTPAPTPAPIPETQAPTGGVGGLCFSSSSTVEVLDTGSTQLKDLKLGDRVHTGNGIYEPVYGFGHFNVDAKSDFLQVKTDKATLELTQDHMVFSSPGAIPASMVQIGDQLVNGQGENLLVQSIKSISSTGAIAPFTPSGKVVVDGILASSFVAFGSDSHLSVGGINFSYQWLAHSFEFPHRMACNYLTQCLQETYTEDGVSQWVDAPHRMTLWMMTQSDLVQNLLGVLVVATLIMFNVLEFMVLHPLSTAVGAYSAWRIVRRRGAKQL